MTDQQPPAPPVSSTEAGAIASTDRPVTQSSLVADLRSLGVDAGDLVMVHTSLSALGWIIGGAHAVVESLLEAVGEGGTLAMPSQSAHLSEPSRWQAPPVPEQWFEIIRAEMPAYDPATTPTRMMGAVVECFRHYPGTLRSGNPQLSVAANGAHAQAITANHTFAACLGDESPLGRLYDLDAKVLLLGVGHGNNTSLHLAEHRADWPTKTNITQAAPIVVDGARVWTEVNVLDINEDDFEDLGKAFAKTGEQIEGPVGAGIGKLMSMRSLVDFATTWMATNR